MINKAKNKAVKSKKGKKAKRPVRQKVSKPKVETVKEADVVAMADVEVVKPPEPNPLYICGACGHQEIPEEVRNHCVKCGRPKR